MTSQTQVLDESPLADEAPALIEAAALLLQLHKRPVSARELAMNLPRDSGGVRLDAVLEAIESHGFSARIIARKLEQIAATALPVILLLRGGGACVLERLGEDARILMPETGMGAQHIPLDELNERYIGYVIFARPLAAMGEPTGEAGSAGGVAPNGRWFWRVLWRFKVYYIESLVASVFLNTLGIAISLYVMNVYDRVVPNNALNTLWVLSIGVALAIFFEFVLRCLRGYFLDLAAKNADLGLSAQVFRQVLGIRLENKPRSTGDFAAQLREMDSIREFLASATLVVFADLPFAVLFVAVIAMLGGALAWVPLLCIPLVVGVGLALQIPLDRYVRRNMKENFHKNGVLVEAVENLETIKALGAWGLMRERWDRACYLAASSGHASKLFSSVLLNFSQFVLQLATVALVVAGVHLIADGKMTQGALFGCVILLGRALAPLALVAGLLARYQGVKMAYQGLQNIMRLPQETDASVNPVRHETFKGAIAIDNVEFHYPASSPDTKPQPVLITPDLQLEAGEHVGIIGSVGSGKTTLLKLLAGLYRPTKGVILYDALDLRQINITDVRANVAIVTQDANLFRGTLRENLLAAAPHASERRMIEVATLCGVADWVVNHTRGYDMPIGEGGDGLSGGQKQMVSLARALLCKPRVLLLDEPTSSQDPAFEQRLIQRLGAEIAGRTLVLVTHRPQMLALVDRLIVIEQGKVVAAGPRDAVLKRLTAGSLPAGVAS